MTIIKSKPNFLLLLVLVSCFATVHADTGNRSLFAKYSGFAAVNHSQDVVNLSGNEQAPWRARYGPGFGEAVLAILGGVVGNFVGICAGVYIANLGSGDGGFADPIMGGLAGSVCGSTLGVYLAGSAGGCKGKFGSALLGSLLGEAAAVVLACVIPGEEFPFLTGFFILPPIGAVILFNLSGTSRSFQAGNGLLHLAEGKLRLGVPDVHVRPVMVPGGRFKAEMQFNVRVLSVEI